MLPEPASLRVLSSGFGTAQMNFLKFLQGSRMTFRSGMRKGPEQPMFPKERPADQLIHLIHGFCRDWFDELVVFRISLRMYRVR